MRICCSEYSYELVKNCRFGTGLNKQGNLKCSCKKDCALCSVGGKVTTTLKIKSETASKRGEKIGGGVEYRKIKKAAPRIDREVHSQQVPIWVHPELHEEYIQKQALTYSRAKAARFYGLR